MDDQLKTFDSILVSVGVEQNLASIAVILAWIARADGARNEQKLAAVRQFAVGVKLANHFEQLIGLTDPISISCLQLACALLQSRLVQSQKEAFLELGCGVAVADGRMSISELVILRFLSGLFGYTASGFNMIAERSIRYSPAPLGDPSSLIWWEKVENMRSHRSSSHPAPNLDLNRLKALAVLGLDENASLADIKSAYRRLSQVHHPDRFMNSGPEAVAAATESFKRIHAAYDFLIPKVKDLYKRTGINPTASAEVIGKLLAREPDSEDRAAAAQILQVEHRRRVYDRVRETYVTLGAVGANLRMSAEIPEDFRQPSTAFEAQIPRYLKRYRCKSPHRNRGLLAPFIFLGFVGIVAILSRLDKSGVYVPTASNSSPARTVPIPQEPLTRSPTPTLIPTPTPFDRPAKPLPNSGAFWTFTSQARIAPFKITTQSGGRYYIKLVDARSKASVVAIFVDGAQTIQVDVPLGTFELRYATGWVWYGQKYLFGPKTQCTRGMDFLTFTEDGDYVSGHDVTLYKVPDGNFATTEVDASEF